LEKIGHQNHFATFFLTFSIEIKKEKTGYQLAIFIEKLLEKSGKVVGEEIDPKMSVLNVAPLLDSS